MSKSLLLLLIAALCIVASATVVTVQINRPVMEGRTAGLTHNFWATEANSTTPIYSSSTDDPFLFHLTVGQTYTFHIAHPTYYHYSLEYLVENKNDASSLYLYFPIVPIASGVTLVNLGLEEPTSIAALTNFTFPAGVFDFSYLPLSPLTGINEGAYFGAGVPPAQFHSSNRMARFSTLHPGTYRVYSEAWADQNNQTKPNYADFTMLKSHYGIFAGEDAVTGFKGSFSSEDRDEINWYIGDIVVTKNASDCIVYDWATVNAYSFDYGSFDETSHPVTLALTEECFNVSSPSSLECVDVLFDQSEPHSICGAFGDPHFIKFDGVGVTCGNQTYVVLVDNAYFTIGGYTKLVVPTSTATHFESIILTYKLPCNPITVTFTDAGVDLSRINAPFAYRHALRSSDFDIFIDALHLRFHIQKWDNAGVLFGVSMPTSLATASTGVCSNSCPGYEEDLSKKREGLANRFASLAAGACDGIPTGTYEYDSCVFDVGLTGDAAYAVSAALALNAKNQLKETWTIPAAPPSWPQPPSDTVEPTSTPLADSTPYETGMTSPENLPSAETSMNSSSIVKPTLLALVVAVISILF